VDGLFFHAQTANVFEPPQHFCGADGQRFEFSSACFHSALADIAANMNGLQGPRKHRKSRLKTEWFC
jgi:hypothetical protein